MEKDENEKKLAELYSKIIHNIPTGDGVEKEEDMFSVFRNVVEMGRLLEERQADKTKETLDDLAKKVVAQRIDSTPWAERRIRAEIKPQEYSAGRGNIWIMGASQLYKES